MGILRLILALSVVLAHSTSIFGFELVGGQLAVQAFYIISGFYMSLILNEKYIGVNGSYKLFITNRFLRLFPVYWIVLLLTISLSTFLSVYTKGQNLAGFSPYFQYGSQMSAFSWVFLIFTNLFLFFQDAVMFLGLNPASGQFFFTSNYLTTDPHVYSFLFIPQAWTIGVEISFYLIAPFIVRRDVKTILFCIFLSLSLRAVLIYQGLSGDPWSYRFFPTEMLFFLLGILSYKIYLNLQQKQISKSYLTTAWIILLAFILFFNFLPIPYKGPLFLFSFFLCLPFVFMLTKKWKRDSVIGELSYPVYISHLFILSCLNIIPVQAKLGSGIILCSCSVVFSYLLNELVNKRIENIRQKRVKAT